MHSERLDLCRNSFVKQAGTFHCAHLCVIAWCSFAFEFSFFFTPPKHHPSRATTLSNFPHMPTSTVYVAVNMLNLAQAWQKLGQKRSLLHDGRLEVITTEPINWMQRRFNTYESVYLIFYDTFRALKPIIKLFCSLQILHMPYYRERRAGHYPGAPFRYNEVN